MLAVAELSPDFGEQKIILQSQNIFILYHLYIYVE